MKIVMIGFGAMASSLLPLLKREFRGELKSLTIIDPHIKSRREVWMGIPMVWVSIKLTPKNYKQALASLDSETFVVNLSVDVSSLDLIRHCQENSCLYLDTCIEPWAGHYVDPDLEPSARTNYALREAILALKGQVQGGPTAVVAHGANPGMVSHFAKQALLDIHRDVKGKGFAKPESREEWARLAYDLNVKTIHVAEHDTQIAKIGKAPNEFVNTWSVDGFIAEGCQPAEVGWGTHERFLPSNACHHQSGCSSAVYLQQPGASIRVKTWTPAVGPCLGFLITHNETVSLSDYLTLFDRNELVYRPTVNYAYHPCSDAVLSMHELSGRSWIPQEAKRVLHGRDISSGADYLGVLLMGHEKNAYWYGSSLTNSEAQAINCESSATSLQVVAGVIAGMKWAIANPHRGIVESEEMDFDFVLKAAEPYLGKMVGQYTDWVPGSKIDDLFSRRTVGEWQFESFME